MNKKMKTLLTLILIGMFIIACSSYSSNEKNNGNIGTGNTQNTGDSKNNNELLKKLMGTSWILESSSNKDIKILKDNPITIRFSENEINGKSIVNSYFAGYKITGNNITINQIGQTLRGGPKDLMDNEKFYFDILGNVKKIELIDENTLVLKNDKDELVFKKSL